MTETTDREASTLHRLLEIGKIDEDSLYKNAGDYEGAPIDADIIIVDEMSMVDMFLMNYLLKCIYQGTKLILVGDEDQLQSVGPGSVLKDLIHSEQVTTIHLDKIFRQAAKSKIILNAHQVNHGEPFVQKESEEIEEERKQDFFFIKETSQEKMLAQVISLCTGRLKNYGNYDFFQNIQVLSPTKKGMLGTKELNKALQQQLNPNDDNRVEKSSMGAIYRVGDIDNDGALLESDLTLLENFLAGEISLTKIQRLAADVNGDNKVNSTDKDMIEKHINQETPLENALEEKTYEEEFVPLETYRVGDPTDDGKIDNSDVELIEWIINKETEEEVTAKQRYASDVNGDEQVTEVDKDLVISYIEGSTDSIPNALEEKVIPGQYQKRVTLTVTNVPIDIKISKYEIAKEKELKGAKIKILNSEGEVFYEYTSKGEREEFGISTGEYTLIEETCPKGYENLQIEIKFRVGTDGNIEIISEETNLYKIIRSEEEKDKDMDHIIIYNKLAEVKVPNTASTITVVGVTLGIGLIGYGGYQVYRRYKTIGI